jgi:uncharacterized protein YqgC (DUF456 family)
MAALFEILRHVAHWSIIVLIWLLCLGGIGLSCLSISGTWLVAVGAVLALFVKSGDFPGWLTVVSFLLVSGGVEVFEAYAGAWGVTRRGGSKLAGLAAVVGGLLGMVLGGLVPLPIVGSLLGMLVGSFALAYAVERSRLRCADQAANIAFGAVTARVLVILFKVCVTLAMAAFLLIGMIVR